MFHLNSTKINIPYGLFLIGNIYILHDFHDKECVFDIFSIYIHFYSIKCFMWQVAPKLETGQKIVSPYTNNNDPYINFSWKENLSSLQYKMHLYIYDGNCLFFKFQKHSVSMPIMA